MTNEGLGSGCWLGAEECIGDFLRGLGTHVEDLGVGGQGESSLLEEAFHGAGIAGGDAEFATGGDGLEAGITVRGHLAKIGDGFKAGIGVAELLQDFVFHAGGNDLGVGAAAVEDGGRGTQKGAKKVEISVGSGGVLRNTGEGGHGKFRPKAQSRREADFVV